MACAKYPGGDRGEIFVDSGYVDPVCKPPDAACEQAGPAREPSMCHAREVLQRVGDKWSVFVIDLLGQGTMRFGELHRSIDGITARMLTVTLRGLERDGIVTRTIHPVIPPRVEYALTPMGRTLLHTIGQLVSWSVSHLPEIDAARAAYDARHPAP
jgi:DNA-binding HxlR family transcriptional regulator